jgi:hypothetical protein
MFVIAPHSLCHKAHSPSSQMSFGKHVSGDRGHKLAERDEVQHLLRSAEHFPVVNAIYARYFPEDPPTCIFVWVPEWPGPFEIDCVAVI